MISPPPPPDRDATDAHPADDALRAYACGQVSAEESTRITQHQAKCDFCRQRVARIGDETAARPHGAESSVADSVVPADYEIEDEIGQGGMGIVYRARHLALNRVVALKQIKDSAELNAVDLARFHSEAAAMGGLRHDNIVQIYEVGEHRGLPYLACELVPDGSMDRYLSGPLPIRAACRLVALLARAIHVAHRHHVIHRDLKPSNILLAFESSPPANRDDERPWENVTPKIGDFGLSKRLDGDAGCTQAGAIVGTPEYMAPEQMRAADDVTITTDVYALGIILYECLTGRRPFQGVTLVDTMRLVQTGEPVSPRRLRPRLPRDLETICLKSIEKDPQRRYSSALLLAQDLEAWLEGRTVRARPASATERILKWSRRNPAWATLTILAALILASLMVGFSWHKRRLQTELAKAGKNQTTALAHFRRGYDAIDRMHRRHSLSRVDTPQWHASRRAMLAESLNFYRTALADADESDPEVRFARGLALLYAGSVQQLLERNQDAITDLKAAIDKLTAVQERDRGRAEVQSALGRCYYWMGRAKWHLADSKQAERLYLRGLELLRPLAEERDLPRILHRLAQQHSSLGWLYRSTLRWPESAICYRRALELHRRIRDQAPQDEANRIKLAEVCNELAVNGLIQNTLKEEERQAYHREAESALLKNDRPLNSNWALTTLASTYEQIGRCDDGIRAIERVLMSAPADGAAKQVRFRLWRKKAWTLSRANRADEAMTAWNTAIEVAPQQQKSLCRTERALERALLGDHVSASAEAANIAAESNLQPVTLTHLARVFSESMQAARTDRALRETKRQHVLSRYAAHAVACLARTVPNRETWQARLPELQNDVRLLQVLRSPEFKAWKSRFSVATTVNAEKND